MQTTGAFSASLIRNFKPCDSFAALVNDSRLGLVVFRLQFFWLLLDIFKIFIDDKFGNTVSCRFNEEMIVNEPLKRMNGSRHGDIQGISHEFFGSEHAAVKFFFTQQEVKNSNGCEVRSDFYQFRHQLTIIVNPPKI